ncbi:MAG: FadR family transcriptional regulator [Desulfobacterales bacterium]|nr:MAG: FadR family transcriptional regulator [Desulfobacterales bacterium]
MVRPSFQPIKQEKISAKIAGQIKSLIAKGELKPGDVLPPERELVKVFKVSRASLREALKSLTGMGFLEITHTHRTIVKSLAAGRITEPLDHLIREDIHTVFELIEVRKAIETWNAYYAAVRADDEDVARLESSIGSMRQKIDQHSSAVEDDANFHIAVSQAAHNKIQTHLMFSIYDLLKESIANYFDNFKLNYILDQHYRVVEAIKKNDPVLASRRMREHLDYVESVVKEHAVADHSQPDWISSAHATVGRNSENTLPG